MPDYQEANQEILDAARDLILRFLLKGEKNHQYKIVWTKERREKMRKSAKETAKKRLKDSQGRFCKKDDKSK